MRWNIGSTSILTPPNDLPVGHPDVSASLSKECPVDHKTMKTTGGSDKMAKCPVDHASLPKPPSKPTQKEGMAKCPVKHDQPSDLNPLNNIPKELSALKQPGQILDLPTERTASTIPRPKGAQGQDEGDVWDYPSPQQFYNALVRKGWETPEDSIETVVAIHNWYAPSRVFSLACRLYRSLEVHEPY